MYPAINAWTFQDLDGAAAWIDAAADAGFGGLELVVGNEGPLTPDTALETFRALAQRAAAAGVRLTSIATALFWEYNYGSSDAGARRRAVELTRTLLAQAEAAGAGAVLVVPAVLGKASDPVGRVAYADALAWTAEALGELRHDAERAGVTIALENVWNRFLLSPLEVADLLDRVNSPHVGFYFDVGNVLAYGYPEDWIATLGHRIRRVHVKDFDVTQPGWQGFCELGAGSVNWPRVVQALRDVGYDGPLTYEGRGAPAALRSQIEAYLAAESPGA